MTKRRGQSPSELASRQATPPKRRGERGKDKKPRKMRTDQPEKFLPSPEESAAIRKARGTCTGRPRGLAYGWTTEEREWCIRIAQLEAAAIMEVLWPEGQPCPVMVSTEDWHKAVAEAVPPEIREGYQRMLLDREVRLEALRRKKEG